MLRQEVAAALDHDPHFEWRGKDVTRIENLSDIVFAIAFGMLVMSGEAPRNFDELNQFLFSIVPVTFGFVVMIYIWNGHFTFFRRYALADRTVIFLNGVLLLMVLVIAYPLRFIFEGLYGFVLLTLGNADYVTELRIDFRRAGIIMGYFAGGFVVTELLFATMYAYALSKADDIGLNEVERALTRQVIWVYATGASWAALAGIMAVFTPMGGFAGFLLNGTAFTSPLIRRLTTPAAISAPSSRRRRTPGASPAPAPDSSAAQSPGR